MADCPSLWAERGISNRIWISYKSYTRTTGSTGLVHTSIYILDNFENFDILYNLYNLYNLYDGFSRYRFSSTPCPFIRSLVSCGHSFSPWHRLIRPRLSIQVFCLSIQNRASGSSDPRDQLRSLPPHPWRASSAHLNCKSRRWPWFSPDGRCRCALD